MPFVFSEMAQCFSTAALSVDVLGHTSIPRAARGKLALTASLKLVWLEYFPLVCGTYQAGSSAGTNQKSSGVFSGIVLGFTCWELVVCPAFYSVSGEEGEPTRFQIFK